MILCILHHPWVDGDVRAVGGISRVDSIFMKLVSGGMSGVVSRTACAPFSRLSVLQETRVSVQSAGNLIVAEKNNIYQTLRSIYQKDGEGLIK